MSEKARVEVRSECVSKGESEEVSPDVKDEVKN